MNMPSQANLHQKKTSQKRHVLKEHCVVTPFTQDLHHFYRSENVLLQTLSGTSTLFDKRSGDGSGIHAFIDSGGGINLSMGDGLQLNAGGSSSGSIDADGWHHVAISVDRDGNADFYIDGMLSGSSDVSIADGFPFGNSAPLLFGKSQNDSNYLHGAIDEIRVWKEARTDLEIAQNYATKLANPSAEAKLGGYWNFDNIDTHDEEYADDLSANGNRLYAGDPLVNDGTDMASGETVSHLIRASAFDGSTSNVDLSANAAQLSTGTGSFTYEAWVKTTSTADGEILTIGENVGTNDISTQFRTQADGTVKLQMANSGTGPASTATVNDGLWHHVAVRYDAATGMATLIIDGEEDGTAAISPNLGSSVAYIGQNASADGIFFDGEIADVRVWNYARDTGEIAEGRDNFPQPNEHGLVAHYKLDAANDTSVVVDSSVNGLGGTSSGVTVNEAGAGVYQTEITMNEDQTFSGNIAAVSPDGDLSLVATPQTDAATAQGGTVNVNVDGEFTYTPPDGYLGPDTFDITVTDENSNATTQTITINTVAYDDPPALLGIVPTSGALQFDGADDQTSIVAPTGLGFGTGDFTLEAWINPNDPDSLRTLIDSRSEISQLGLTFALEGSGGSNQNKLSLAIREDASTNTVVVSDTPVPDDEWSHVAVTVDRDGDATFYINGVASGGGDISPRSDVDLQNDEIFRIGHALSSSSYGSMNGQMDDVRAWSELRTPEEIAATYQQRLDGTVDTTNLAGYWRFDSIADDGLAYDLSGNENDAVVGHGSPADPMSAVMSFDGDDDITAATAPAISGSHSAEAWFRTTSTGTVVIMSTEDANVDAQDYMQIRLDNGQPVLEVGGDSGGDGYTLTENALNDGEWHHIAYSYDASTQIFAAYLDGAPAGGALGPDNDIGNFDPNGVLQIGTSRTGGSGFEGEISDVRLWDDIRTPAEISENFDARLNGGEEGLAAYYRLDKDGTDSTANANDGAVTGATLLDVSPMPIPFARAMTFDGAGDGVLVADTDDTLDPDSFTIEAWARADFDDTGSHRILVNDSTNGANATWSLSVNNGTFRFNSILTDGSTVNFDSGVSATDGLNHHVAATYDADTMTFRMYVDGNLVGEQTSSFHPEESQGTVAIGRFNASTAQGWEGTIADVRVWSEAHTVNQIRDGMAGYIGGNVPGLVGNWRLNDDLGDASTGTVAADSAGVNDGSTVGDPQFDDGAAPIHSYQFATDEDIAVHGSLVAEDVDSGSLTFTVAKGADHGELYLGSDGAFIYTPAENYAGPDSFQVQVSDGSTRVTRTINVSVEAENDAPRILGAQTLSGTIQFDGVDDYIQVDHHDDMNPGEGSFSVQVMVDFRDTTTAQSLISKGNVTSSVEGWNIFIQSGYLYARMGNGGTDSSDKAELKYDLTGIDGWHQVAFTLDQDNGTFEAYFDGSSTGWTETAGRDNDPTGWDISNTDPLLMGKATDGTLQATAAVDEVRIWNRALSEGEVRDNQHTELTGAESDLAAYWQFEADQHDHTNGLFIDQTGNGHDAYLGSLTPGDDAEPLFIMPPTQAMEFTGSDKIVVPDSDQFSTGTEDFSVEAWIYRNADGVEEVIIDNRDSAFKGWMLGVSTDDKLELAMEDANGDTSNVFSTSVIPTGQWVHVAVTADRDGDATFYVNGVEGGAASIEATPGSLTSVSNLLIGDTDTSGSTYGGWNGMISDVRIWDHVRDASDIGGDNFGHLAQPQSGLLGNWRLDDASGTGEAVDVSGNENHGAITGATSVTTSQNIHGSSIAVSEDTPMVGILRSDDTEGDSVSWSLETGPDNGRIDLLADGTFTYTPDGGYSGADSFTARVTDANGASRTQTFAVTVEDRTDAPEVLGVSGHETALQFDGQSVLSAGRGNGDALAITGDLTVEMWVNPAELKLAHLLSFGTNQETLAGNTLYALEMQADGALRLFHEDASLANVTPTTSTPALTAGDWAHVAAVRDTDAGTVSFYVNGDLLETVEYAGEAAGGSASELLFGALDLEDDFSGQMDEVRVWNSARTGHQIAENYQRKLSDAEIEAASDLAGYWDFDETDQYGVYVDLSGNGADAVPGRVADVTGHLSRYTTFDGTDDNVVIANNAAQIATSITVEAWFRADPAGTGVQRIVTKENSLGGGNAYSLALDGSGYLTGYADGGATLEGSTDLRDGEWHHAAFVVTPGIGSTKLYLDGEQIDSSLISISIPASTKPVVIGDYDDDDGSEENFKGDIADVRIWDTARSASEIADNRATVFDSSETDLVGYLRLDDMSGTTAIDSSATGVNGTLQNGAAFVDDTLDKGLIAQHVARHATFDGAGDATGDNIVIADNAVYETSTLSVEVWFRAEVDQDTGLSYHRLVTKPTTGNGNVFSLGFTEATGQLFGAAGSSFITPATGVGPDLRDGEWHHAAMTMQPGTNASSLYLDGVLIHTGNQGTHSGGDASPLMIGDFDDDGSHPQNFKGDIADVRIWSDIRTQAEIHDNLLNTFDSSEPGLVGYWKLDEDVSGTVTDLSSTGNNGTLQNDTAIVDTAPLPVPVTGKTLRFDGSTYVDAGDIDALDGLSQLSIAAWINSDDAGSGNDNIVSKWSDTGQGFVLRLQAGGQIEVLLSDDGSNFAQYWYDADIGAGEWAHVAMSLDVSSGTPDLKVFRDGAEVTLTGSSNPSNLDMTTLSSTASTLKIGARESTGGSIVQYFNGEIADVQIYDAVLDEADLSTVMAGTSPALHDPVGHWPLDEGVGSTATDVTRFGNDGTITGGTWIDTGPDIYADQTFVIEGDTLRGDIGVRDGDTGESFTFAVIEDTHFGELIVDPVTGAFTYEPVPNFTGQDTFIVSVTDSDGYTARKELTIEVDNKRNEDPHIDGYDGGSHISLADAEVATLAGAAATATDFTVETWFRADGSQDDGDILLGSVGGTHEYGVKFNGSGGLEGFIQGTAAAGPAINVLDGEWHHVAFTFDGLSTDFKIVVDGQEGTTETQSFSSASGILTFGSSVSGSGLVGDIDEIRLWNEVRATDDIQTFMNTTVGPLDFALDGYWRADEGTGTTVTDLTGNGNDGTVPAGALQTDQNSALPLSHAGRSSLTFDAVNESIANLGSVPVVNDAFAFTVWANVHASGTENRILELNDGNGAGSNLFELSVGDAGELIVTINDGSTPISATLDTDWTYDKWAHFGVSFDGDDLNVYVDGELAGTVDASSLSSLAGSSADLNLGNSGDTTGLDFTGALSELRMWNTDITEAMVRTDMLGRVPASAVEPVEGYWPLSDGDMAAIYDHSGNGHTGSSFATIPTNDVPPLPGTAAGIEFDGSTGYVKAEYEGGGDNPLALKGDMTVEFWVNPENFGAGRVFRFSGEVTADGEPDNSLYELYITTGGDVQWVQENGAGSNEAISAFTSTGISAGAWSHVAVTRDATAKTLTLYVDGTQAGSPVSYTNHPTGGENGALFLGVNGGMQHFFDGQIADFRVWDDVRTATEISESLSHELVGGEEGLVGYWPLSEGNENVAHDLTANGTDAGLYGAADWIDGRHIATDESVAVSGRVGAGDLDSESVTFSLETDGVNGSVSVNADGTYTYTPDTSYTGPDTFTVKVTDAVGRVDYSTVSVTVVGGAVNWIGTSQLSDVPDLATNWSSGTVPSGYDIVTVTTDGGNYDPMLTGPLAIGRLDVLGTGDFHISESGLLYLATDDSQVGSGATLTHHGLVVGPGGIDVVSGGTFDWYEGSIATDRAVTVDGTLIINGGAKELHSNLVITGTATIPGTAVDITGAGAIHNAGDMTTDWNATIGVDFVNLVDGTFKPTAAQRTLTFDGAFENYGVIGSNVAQGLSVIANKHAFNAGTIDILVVEGASLPTFSANDGMTNVGVINLGRTFDTSFDARLDVEGTFDNEGTINVSADFDASAHILTVGHFRNRGVLNVDHNLAVSTSGSTVIVDLRGGTLDIASGATFSVTGSNAKIIIDDTTTLTGGGTLQIDSGTAVQLGSDFVYDSSMPALDFFSSNDFESVDGNDYTFTIGAGAEINSENTFDFKNTIHVVNEGSITINDNTSFFRGGLDNDIGGTITIKGGGNGGTSRLTVIDNLVNRGTIMLAEEDVTDSDVELVVNGDSNLENYGTISTAHPGSASGSAFLIAAQLTNYGTVNANHDLEFNVGTSTDNHVNRGTINIASGATMAIGSGDTFTNDETGAITGAGTLDVSGAAGGTMTNNGIIEAAGNDTAGTLSVIGDMINTESSVIDIEVGNGTGDTLDVSGQMTMAGTLSATFLTASTPVAGDIFNAVSFGSSAAGSYFDDITGLEGDGAVMLDILIDEASGVTFTAVDNDLSFTSGNDTFDGSSVEDYVYGGDGNDDLVGGGGADVLIGGAGDDVIEVSDNAFHFVDGGEGTDTLVAYNGLDMSVVRNDIIDGFERLDLGFGALTINGDDVRSITDGTNALTGTENTLVVTRNDFGGAVDIGSGWDPVIGPPTTLTIDGATRTFDVRQHGDSGALLYLETAVSDITTDLDGVNGFTIATENPGLDTTAISVTALGDMNGDGFTDFAYSMDENNGTATYTPTYVVFGSGGNLDADFDIAQAVTDGEAVRLTGTGYNELAIASGGDVNNDGYADMLIGNAEYDNGGDLNTGRVSLVFGSATMAAAGTIDVSALDGSDGYSFIGAEQSDGLGAGVSSGDIDGDGHDDIAIAAPLAGNNQGTAYVIYGAKLTEADALDGSVDGRIEVAELHGANGGDGTVGFTASAVAGSADGTATVALGGDFNGDGLDDLLVGNPTASPDGDGNAGETFLVFGSAGNQGPDINLSATPDGTSFVRFKGVSPGDLAGTVSSAGDLNGDGLDDILIGAPLGGKSYVVYGKSDWSSTATIELSALNGSDGFRIDYDTGSNDGSYSAIGDMNGDGFDDIAVTDGDNDIGYVLFGGGDFGATVDLNDIGEQGFSFTLGEGEGVTGTDINGDGYSDLIAGSRDDDAAYVIYGGDFLDDASSTGTSGADTLIGTADNDILDGGAGGADVLIGGAGNDRLFIGDENFTKIDGGGGQDTLFLDGGFDLDLSEISNGLITGIEHIDMNNEMMNVLDIDFSTVLDIGEAIDRLVGEANMLVISRDFSDEVNLVGDWVMREEQPQEAIDGGYTVYDSEDSYASVAIQNVADPGQGQLA